MWPRDLMTPSFAVWSPRPARPRTRVPPFVRDNCRGLSSPALTTCGWTGLIRGSSALVAALFPWAAPPSVLAVTSKAVAVASIATTPHFLRPIDVSLVCDGADSGSALAGLSQARRPSAVAGRTNPIGYPKGLRGRGPCPLIGLIPRRPVTHRLVPGTVGGGVAGRWLASRRTVGRWAIGGLVVGRWPVGLGRVGRWLTGPWAVGLGALVEVHLLELLVETAKQERGPDREPCDDREADTAGRDVRGIDGQQHVVGGAGRASDHDAPSRSARRSVALRASSSGQSRTPLNRSSSGSTTSTSDRASSKSSVGQAS